MWAYPTAARRRAREISHKRAKDFVRREKKRICRKVYTEKTRRYHRYKIRASYVPDTAFGSATSVRTATVRAASTTDAWSRARAPPGTRTATSASVRRAVAVWRTGSWGPADRALTNSVCPLSSCASIAAVVADDGAPPTLPSDRCRWPSRGYSLWTGRQTRAPRTRSWPGGFSGWLSKTNL